MNIVEAFRQVRLWNRGRKLDIYDKYADEWTRVFCKHDWREAVYAATGSAWEHGDRFLFCVKCRQAKEK